MIKLTSMKTILFLILLLSASLVTAQVDIDASAGTWFELERKASSSYEDVQHAFYQEWKNKEYTKHKGYKQFKRWEDQWKGREKEYLLRKQGRYIREVGNYKSSNNSSWTLVGPTEPPLPPLNSGFTSWNNEGIGLIEVIEFHPVEADILYAGSPTGGLWKSTDDGGSWQLISNQTRPNQGVSDITICSASPDVMYVATGSRDSRGDSFEGIMKSSDGGLTWTTISSLSVFRALRLLVHPTDPDRLYIATDRGVYTSVDGGLNWVLSSGLDSYADDLEFKPGDANTLYSSSNGSIYKSIDGGLSFSIVEDLPYDTNIARFISIATTPANPEVVMYMVATSNSLLGVYKSVDSGDSFTEVVPSDGWGQVWYNWTLAISPIDENDFICGEIRAHRSTPGSNELTIISRNGSIHVDMHHVNYNPHTNVPYIGCDGGIYRESTPEAIWERLNDLSVSQMYTLAVCETQPENLVCGLQDNGMMYRLDGQWYGAVIGDVLSCAIDPLDPQVMYGATTSNDMTIRKTSNGWQSFEVALSESSINEPLGIFQQPLVVIHPELRHVLYTAYHNVYKSIDGGVTWSNLSGDSVGDRFKSYLTVSESDPNYIYTATQRADDGGVYVSTDGGDSWSNVSFPFFGSTLLFDLKIDPINPLHLFAVSSNTIAESVDGGASWDLMEGAFPELHRRLEITDANELYLATFNGVYYKVGDQDWELYDNDLPNVDITDIEISEFDNTLKCATYGRGIWSSPLCNTSSTCYAPEPIINESGELSLCDTNSFLLMVSEAPDGSGYQWYKGDKPISGASTQRLLVFEDGIYSVVYKGSCKSFSSDFVRIVDGCKIRSCSDYNQNSAQGPGQFTIVDLTDDLLDAKVGSEIDVCFSIEGDTGDSREQFDVLDENFNLLTRTATVRDCSGPSTVCITITDSEYNNWKEDGNIRFYFDPVQANFINPNLCSINEACVDLTVRIEKDCPPNLTINQDPIDTGLYEARDTVMSSGRVSSLGTIVFRASDAAVLTGDFQVDEGGLLDVYNVGCDN